MSFRQKTIHYFHVHTSVVIRTFPESRLVIIGVHRAVGTHAPMPFSVLVVYQMLLDEVPTSESLLHGHFVIKVLVEVGMSHYVLGLHPPVAVSIGLSFIQKSLVYRPCPSGVNPSSAAAAMYSTSGSTFSRRSPSPRTRAGPRVSTRRLRCRAHRRQCGIY